MQLGTLMLKAVEEAEESLRMGNNGFGAVIARGGTLLAGAHDTEQTEGDPTSHAEINAIRTAAPLVQGDFAGCILVSTHEPCPMCAGAILWAGIRQIAFGYSIERAVEQGRTRINLPCREVFDRAGGKVQVHEGILEERCSLLYNRDVRREIESLRGVTGAGLAALCEDSATRRLAWFRQNRSPLPGGDNLLDEAYHLLLERLRITPHEAPIVRRSETSLTFHSQNFCPTLEACKILGLDTRYICKNLNEASTDLLLKQLNPRLSFRRNYNALRPYTNYCEESIILEQQ